MHQPEANTGRNKWLAVLMGLAMPGLGQIYNGEPIKGISYFVILQVLYILGFRWTVLLPDKMLIFGALGTILAVIILYAAAAIDSYRKAATASYQPAVYNRWYFYVAVWLSAGFWSPAPDSDMSGITLPRHTGLRAEAWNRRFLQETGCWQIKRPIAESRRKRGTL